MKVLVGLSGGVDSAVAVYELFYLSYAKIIPLRGSEWIKIQKMK